MRYSWMMSLWAGLLAAATLRPAPLAAQAAPLSCLLLPLAPAERVAAATLIVEAQVLDARGEWDAGHQRIYTRQQLRVFRILKGTLPDTAALPLLVEGGQVGLQRQELTNTLRPLAAGQQGLFFLVPAPWPGVAPAWAAYASSQGVIAYDLRQNTAAEPARTYATPAAAARETEQLSKQAPQVLRANPTLAAAQLRAVGVQRVQAPVISSFSPTQATAGTGAVLTLVGSGFGSDRGSGGVEFRNADDGGATTTRTLAFDYLSWSDTRIQVRVPSMAEGQHPAGTGLVRVVTADGGSADSATPLTITYALTNIGDAAGTFVERPGHVATNGTGGLSFSWAPTFRSNAAAGAAWQRALSRWRCATGVNWAQGADATSSTIAADNVNVIAFDDNSPLPARVLGRTTSYYQGCYDPQGGVVFYTAEIDQQFATSLPFQFGPAVAGAGQYDFESVATHELGHAQQLAHLIRPGAVMHYGIGAGANLRSLAPASDVAGGRLVLRTRSFRERGCGGAAMLPAPLTRLTGDVSGAYGPNGSSAITFTTSSECFVSGYVLERAAGADTTAAGAGWTPVTSVAATGTGTQYVLADPLTPYPNYAAYYYRLGVRRPDGTTDYAAPVLATGTTLAVQTFPSPLVGDQFHLTFYNEAQVAAIDLRVYDTLGRYVHAQRVAVQPKFNLITLSAAGWPPGVYLLRVTAPGQGSRTARVVRL